MLLLMILLLLWTEIKVIVSLENILEMEMLMVLSYCGFKPAWLMIKPMEIHQTVVILVVIQVGQ